MKRLFLMALLVVMTGNAIFATTPLERLMQPSLYDRALAIIRHYETLHKYPRDWPVIGYGHELKPGETYEPRQYTATEAEAIMRKDYNQFLSYYADYGRDKYLLAALAYNTGLINANKIAALIASGNRNIAKPYQQLSHHQGKPHPALHRRRQIELLLLYEE